MSGFNRGINWVYCGTEIKKKKKKVNKKSKNNLALVTRSTLSFHKIIPNMNYI